MKPHNLTLTMIGAGLLWFGWYGFNVGSIVFTADSLSDPAKFSAQFYNETGVTFMNTTVATMAAMLAWLLIERIMHGKASALGAASGVVAGLVAITPSCGSVSTVGAIAVGAIAGALCAVAIGLKYKLNLDDSLDVVGVHLVGGVTGALLIGFLGTDTSPQGLAGLFTDADGKGMNGIFYGGGGELLLHQALGVLFTIVWCGVFTFIIGLAIKYTIGWRISEEAEVDGIDSDQHGEAAYDLHVGFGGGAGSSVLAKSTVTEGVNA
jgi:Amt family ammonium transporter